jgi:hypothetical protein
METMYYGPATAAAVSKMQVMFRAEVLTPNGLVNPTGYFGASSRAKANDLCVTPVVDAGDEDEDGMEDEDEDEDNGPITLSGEGVLSDVNADDEEDEIEEGEEDVVIATYTLEADDGDIEVARMTFDLNFTGDSLEADNDAWDVFETISLWVDGDMIAEFDASDEDEYLDEDEGTFRFSNLGLVVEEDEEVDVLLAISVQNSIDGADNSPTDATWNVGFTEARVFDADGVASNEDLVGEMSATDSEGNATSNLIDFDLVVEGAGDELELNSASEDPEKATIAVEEGEDEEVMIFAFEIDADGSDSDISLEEMVINLFGTSTESGATNLEDFVSDVRLEIDGQSFDAEDYDGNGNFEELVFDIDGDVVVDEDEMVLAQLFVEFNVSDDFTDATIMAETVRVEGEGSDDITDVETISSEEHDVISSGIIVPIDGVEFTTDTTGDNDTTGTFEIEFEVTAFEGDFYVRDFASTSADGTSGGVQFLVSSSDGTVNTVAASLTSTGDEDNGAFLVEEGETETFTLDVAVTATDTGFFRVTLQEVWFSTGGDGQSGDVSGRVLTPASDYRTGTELVEQPAA